MWVIYPKIEYKRQTPPVIKATPLKIVGKEGPPAASFLN